MGCFQELILCFSKSRSTDGALRGFLNDGSFSVGVDAVTSAVVVLFCSMAMLVLLVPLMPSIRPPLALRVLVPLTVPFVPSMASLIVPFVPSMVSLVAFEATHCDAGVHMEELQMGSSSQPVSVGWQLLGDGKIWSSSFLMSI